MDNRELYRKESRIWRWLLYVIAVAWFLLLLLLLFQVFSFSLYYIFSPLLLVSFFSYKICSIFVKIHGVIPIEHKKKNFRAAMCYPLAAIFPVVPLLINARTDNKQVRFHVVQSLCFVLVAYFVLFIVIYPLVIHFSYPKILYSWKEFIGISYFLFFGVIIAIATFVYLGKLKEIPILKTFAHYVVLTYARPELRFKKESLSYKIIKKPRWRVAWIIIFLLLLSFSKAGIRFAYDHFYDTAERCEKKVDFNEKAKCLYRFNITLKEDSSCTFRDEAIKTCYDSCVYSINQSLDFQDNTINLTFGLYKNIICALSSDLNIFIF